MSHLYVTSKFGPMLKLTRLDLPGAVQVVEYYGGHLHNTIFHYPVVESNLHCYRARSRYLISSI